MPNANESGPEGKTFAECVGGRGRANRVDGRGTLQPCVFLSIFKGEGSHLYETRKHEDVFGDGSGSFANKKRIIVGWESAGNDQSYVNGDEEPPLRNELENTPMVVKR